MVDELVINNELLISLVEQKPVLWDKSMELYKNRVATLAAWNEIMITFDPNLEAKKEKTRQAVAKLIIQRWTHLRDTYSRSYKKVQDQKRSGRGAKTTKPYIYSRQLSFLQKVIRSKESVSNVITDDNSAESENQGNSFEAIQISETNSMGTHDNTPTLSPKPEPKRPMNNDISPLDAKMIKFMDTYSNNEPKQMNRHLSFFYGILPSLEKFDEDEILEFQMGVLQLLKNIKSSRQYPETSTLNVSEGYLKQE